MIIQKGHTCIFGKDKGELTEEMLLKARKTVAIYHRHPGEAPIRLEFVWNEELRDWFRR